MLPPETLLATVAASKICRAAAKAYWLVLYKSHEFILVGINIVYEWLLFDMPVEIYSSFSAYIVLLSSTVAAAAAAVWFDVVAAGLSVENRAG